LRIDVKDLLKPDKTAPLMIAFRNRTCIPAAKFERRSFDATDSRRLCRGFEQRPAHISDDFISHLVCALPRFFIAKRAFHASPVRYNRW
jgi:hypothetical protein